MAAAALRLRTGRPSDEAVVLANPRLPADAVAPLVAYLAGEARFRGHFAIASSGSTAAVPGENKWVLLSRDALLASAEAVNRHLEAGPHDGWLSPLPDFHVGGLGIHARALLAGAPVTPLGAWSPRAFADALKASGATLAALVPAQVFDLVTAGIAAPPGVRAIVVGGGALVPELEIRARALRWPLLASYGLSECASQVATAFPETPAGERWLPLLTHVTAEIDAESRLVLRSPSLLTGYLYVRGGHVRFEDPKRGGALVTGDRAELDGRRLRFLGRDGDRVKVLGENVDLARLRELLDGLRLDLAPGADVALVAVDDARRGSRLELWTASGGTERLVAAFNERVMPFERVAPRAVAHIPRSALGKILPPPGPSENRKQGSNRFPFPKSP